MELLKIENKEGLLCLSDTNKIVSQITAEDISAALELILTKDDIEIPEEIDYSIIVNPAQRIIFEQLYSSFKEVLGSKDALMNEINETFAQAEEKYLNKN